VQNGTLQLNFSPELTQNFEGGSDNEAALINAITSTAGSFPTVERVQILVNNKPIESLGGHIDLSQALPVSR
jgi:spore germination protein GerM